MTLLKFGHAFDVHDLQYWRNARELTEKILQQEKSVDIDTLFQVATYLKQFGMLSNSILRLVAQQMDKANKMTPNQLSLFAMILLSDEMRSVIEL